MKCTTFITRNNCISKDRPSRFPGQILIELYLLGLATRRLANQDILFNSTNPKIHGP